MVQSTHSCPIEKFQKREPRRIVLIFTLHDAKKMWIAFFGEHWMRISIGNLKRNITQLNVSDSVLSVFPIFHYADLNHIPVFGSLRDLIGDEVTAEN